MSSDAAGAAGGAWPALTLGEVEARLTAPGQPFEMETLVLDGVATRSWKNAPPTLGWLAEAARAHGERLFVILEDERISYEASYRATAALARHLQRLGVVKGDRVAIAMRNLPEWPVAFFAAGAIGAIVVPLNAWWTGDELAFALRDSGASVLIVDRERHGRLRDVYDAIPALREVIVARAGSSPVGGIALGSLIGAPAEWSGLPDQTLPQAAVAPDDPATIFYTSGTTGRPKGALGSHRNLMTNILSSAYVAARTALRRGEAVPMTTPRVMLSVIPLFHVTACSAVLMGTLASGSTLVFMRRWDPLEAMALIERERVAVTGGVPTIAWQLIEHPERHRFDLSSLESIGYGGAPSAPELAQRIRDVFGAQPGNGWGMTETMATVTNHTGEDYLHRPTSAGVPVAVADLKIVDPDGETEMPAGGIGELWARGPMVVKGYWNRAEATRETFVHGWVRTGDLAYLDDEGFLFIVDRAKDMVIRGGENIYSIEVENALHAHPAVVDCAVVGVPHRTLGEEPAAVVFAGTGAAVSEAELQAWVRQRLAAFKTPVAIRFVDAPLPRNANGKIVKTALKALFAEAPVIA